MAAKRKKSKKTAGKKRGRGAASIRPSKTQLKRDQKELQTDQKIADKYGVTRQAVQQWREQYEIPSLAEKKGPRNVKILKENDKGVDIDTIAEKYGLSKSQTYRIINQAGKSVKAGTKKKTTKKKSSAKKKAAPKKKTTKKKSSSKKKAAPKKKSSKKRSSSRKKKR